MDTVLEMRRQRVGGLCDLVSQALRTGGGDANWNSRITALGIDPDRAKQIDRGIESLRRLLKDIDRGGEAVRRCISGAMVAAFRSDDHQKYHGLTEMESLAHELRIWTQAARGQAEVLCDFAGKL